MNFYQLHIGDYATAAGHLSMLEDGAYRRLLDVYYSREQPLPLELRDCYKLARAHSKAERDAVAYVIREFFFADHDGFHNERADKIIAEYNDAAPEREAKKANNRDRVQRHRERRKALFESLRALDVVPDYNASTGELEALLKRLSKRESNAPVTHYDTANQYPIPNTHNKDQKQALESVTPGRSTTTAGRACLLMREAGCIQTNPSHPDLLAAIAEGVEPETLADTVREAIEANKPKPFAWAIATARGRHEEGAKPRGSSHAPSSPKLSAADQVFAAIQANRARRTDDEFDPIPGQAVRVPR